MVCDLLALGNRAQFGPLKVNSAMNSRKQCLAIDGVLHRSSLCHRVSIAIPWSSDPPPSHSELDTADALEAYRSALFVTWSTLRTNGKKSLRGCIGNFTPQALEAGLADYALVSALEDSRFSPIRASELSCLQCSVSLLTPFTSVDDILAWTPGVHGIHISFRHPRTGRKLSATYLPDVVVEQGWSKEEAILSLIHKAGYSGSVSPGDAVWNSIQLKVYESCKAHADFEEYQAWRKNGALPHHEDEENGKSKPNGVVNGGGGTSSAWK